ncbi:hypothetical protein KGO95_03950 [Patescibacteria group bacterium]|nr:hypothetical protein [Patescibacteria group bacterium]
MEQKNSIVQLLERLSEEFREDPDYQVYHFLNRLGATTLKGLDIYCFREPSADMFRAFHVSGSSYTLIHPFSRSPRALSLSLISTHGNDHTAYLISVGTFDLMKTAGDPVDLAAVRFEKIILDPVAGETQDSIRKYGAYRNFTQLFSRRYIKKLRPGITEWWQNFFLPKEKRMALCQILYDLERLEQTMSWFVENPRLNRLRSRDAFNY